MNAIRNGSKTEKKEKWEHEKSTMHSVWVDLNAFVKIAKIFQSS